MATSTTNTSPFPSPGSLSEELGFLAWRRLTTILDSDSPQQRNWTGLADKMGFNYSTVISLRDGMGSDQSPTERLLKLWQEKKGAAATLDSLVTMLDDLKCKEAADIVRRVITRDSITTTASSGTRVSEDPSREAVATKVGVASSARRFDVFLSYAEEDEEFAEEMRTRLVQANLRVFIPSQGFMSGKVFHEEIAHTIKHECWRTVVILSPSFLSSPWCAYEANLSILRSPDVSTNCLVPVLYKKCDVPPFMSHLYCPKYTICRGNKDRCERFWKKLIKALSAKQEST